MNDIETFSAVALASETVARSDHTPQTELSLTSSVTSPAKVSLVAALSQSTSEGSLFVYVSDVGTRVERCADIA